MATFDKIDKEILQHIAYCIALSGGKSDLLCIIGSWKDTMSDEETLEDLKMWISNSNTEIRKTLDWVTQKEEIITGP